MPVSIFPRFSIPSQSSKFRTILRVFYLSLAIAGLTILITSISYRAKIAASLNPYNPYSSYFILWHWPFNFTVQANLAITVTLFISFFRHSSRFKRPFLDMLWIQSVIAMTLTALTFWLIYGLYGKEYIYGLDRVETFLTIWMHLVMPVATLIIFILKTITAKRISKIGFWWILLVTGSYTLVYSFVVIVLVQWLDPWHWSVYGAATMWWHWVDSSVMITQNVERARPWLSLVIAPVIGAIVLIVYLLKVWLSRLSKNMYSRFIPAID